MCAQRLQWTPVWTKTFMYDIWPEIKIHATKCSPGRSRTNAAMANVPETR